MKTRTLNQRQKKSYPIILTTSVQYLKGIGPKRALRLNRLGIENFRDLLYLVPRRYIDYSRVMRVRDLKVGDAVTISGRILATQSRRTRSGSHMTTVAIGDGSGMVSARWFNRPDLKKRFKVNDVVILSGNVSYYNGKQLVNPNYQIIEANNEKDLLYAGTIIPVYPLTEGLNLWELRRSIHTAYEKCESFLEDFLPAYLIERNNLDVLRKAIYNLHFPDSVEVGTTARRRIVYEELFVFELLLALRRKEILASQRGFVMEDRHDLTERFLSILKFELTAGQRRVIGEIRQDMSSSRMMNRILQGDVGSGKTVVAIFAMLIAIENGFQSALMAPTEILAEQHYLFYSEKLTRMGIKNTLLTGSITGKQRREIIESIRTGDIKVVFGTHALIEADIEFFNLGLVVVDEQHRFGVAQRAALVNKGITPDFLVMTATPIPRTLSMTIYGDLDISLLDEKPPGRKPVVTKLIKSRERSQILGFIKQKIDEGRQAFIVYPIIEETEKMELKSATEAYKEIQRIFASRRVGLIHGRMGNQNRIEVMAQFRKGNIDILVSTTVIEVGVDIPNAIIIAIEHPERFGLAQLHQLRGRVGRGADNSYCFLLLERMVSKETFERLLYFEKNEDGFRLAEKDLEIRGPGEVLGLRQHGLPDFKYADLLNDIDLLKLARDDAFTLVKEDPELIREEHRQLKNFIKHRYQDRMKLFGIG